jgi:protein ImuB
MGGKSASLGNGSDEIRQILSILRKWGIDTLGQLARLDKEELNARLGPVALRLWERAQGKSIRPLRFVHPAETFAESFEFETDVETLEPLLFILRRFLEQLSHRLGAIYLVATELTLGIHFSNKQKYRRDFKIPHPTNDVDLLFRMLHTHLENFKSEHPIVAVSLEAKPSKPARQQFSLFETALRDSAQLSETLARLIGLLGPDRVGTPVLEETHRPDAFRMKEFSWFGGTTSGPPVRLGPSQNSWDATERVPSRVALRRFRPATTVSVLLDVDLPAHVRSAEISGPASQQSGPYLTSGNWWDEKAWARREWDLQLRDGTLLRCHQNPSGWQIDGIYD